MVREEGYNMLRCLHLLITSSTLPRYLLNTINYTYLNLTNADMDLYCAMFCRCVALGSESDDKSPHYLTLLYSALLYSTHSILLYCTYSILFYSILLYCTQLYCTLLTPFTRIGQQVKFLHVDSFLVLLPQRLQGLGSMIGLCLPLP